MHASQRWPNVKLLEITRQPIDSYPFPADAQIAGLNGPRELLRAAEEMLQPNTVPSGNLPANGRRTSEVPSSGRSKKNGPIGTREHPKPPLTLAEPLTNAQDLLGTSQLCIELSRGSFDSTREALASTMNRITRSKEIIAKCDEHLRSHGPLCSKS